MVQLREKHKRISKDTRNETKRIEKNDLSFQTAPNSNSKLRCRGKRVKKGKRNASCELDAKTIRALETSVEWIRR
jgi:hypothetical protein